MKSNGNNRILTIVLDIVETTTVLWWRFFDWLAVVSWQNLAIVCFAVMMVVGPILRTPELGAFLPSARSLSKCWQVASVRLI